MYIIVTSKTAFDSLMVRKNITADNVEDWRSTFFISINSTLPVPQSGEEDEPPYFDKNYANVLVQRFDDVDEDLYREGKGRIATAFTFAQAQEMYDFIIKNLHRKSCVVHCAAGVSRSGAVGSFVNEIIKGDWKTFREVNPHTHPNMHVVQMLRRVHREREAVNGQK